MNRYRQSVSKYEVNPSATIEFAMRVIEANEGGIVFITEDRRLIGCLSDGDIRRALLSGATLKTDVVEVMRTNVLRVDMESPHTDSYKLFGKGVRVIPVVDSSDRLIDVMIAGESLHIPLAKPHIGSREIELVNECMGGGWISSAGALVPEFEKRFAAYVGASQAVSVSNGTTGLVLALKALGIGCGDEVIVPNLTFGATANAVIQVGATPVFVDVLMKSMCMDPTEIEPRITPRTKALLPVHLYGFAADLPEIYAIAKRYSLLVIEDCAEALGTFSSESQVGTKADAGVFSFFANKVMTTGEGGMVVFKDLASSELARQMRSHGFSIQNRYWHETWGTNFRMTNIQAAIGIGQLEQLPGFLDERSRIAEMYLNYLEPRVSSDWALPPSPSPELWSNWLFTLLLPREINPDQVITAMARQGVDSRRIFYPLHLQPTFKQYVSESQDFGNSTELSERGISLPTWVGMRENEINFVASVLESCVSEQSN